MHYTPEQEPVSELIGNALAVSQQLEVAFWAIAESPDFPFHGDRLYDHPSNDELSARARVRSSRSLNVAWHIPDAGGSELSLRGFSHSFDSLQALDFPLGVTAIVTGENTSYFYLEVAEGQVRSVSSPKVGSKPLQPLLDATGAHSPKALCDSLTDMMRTPPTCDRRAAWYECSIASVKPEHKQHTAPSRDRRTALSLSVAIVRDLTDEVPRDKHTITLSVARCLAWEISFEGHGRLLEATYNDHRPNSSHPLNDESVLSSRGVDAIRRAGTALIVHANKLLVAPRKEDLAEQAPTVD